VEFALRNDFLSFCDQTFIKTCQSLEDYEVVTASNLERKVRVTEKGMD
jgi:hypothetical protein